MACPHGLCSRQAASRFRQAFQSSTWNARLPLRLERPTPAPSGKILSSKTVICKAARNYLLLRGGGSLDDERASLTAGAEMTTGTNRGGCTDDWATRAALNVFWFKVGDDAWLRRPADDAAAPWAGWRATDASAIELESDAWQPWSSVCDYSEAPYVRWFAEALTNAAFNELDVHHLQQQASRRTVAPTTTRPRSPRPHSLALPCAQEADAEQRALISELPDGPPATLLRRELLQQSVLAASTLRDELHLAAPSRLAVFMPNHPQARRRRRPPPWAATSS